VFTACAKSFAVWSSSDRADGAALAIDRQASRVRTNDDHASFSARHVDRPREGGPSSIDHPHGERAAPWARADGAFAGQQHDIAGMKLERLIGVGVEAHHRGTGALAGPCVGARPARTRCAPQSGDASEHDNGGSPQPSSVADCRGMARRRAKPFCTDGKHLRAGDLAADAVRKIVPPDQLDLTRVRAAWPEIIGGRLRGVAWPAGLRSGILWVHVRDNQWVHELTYMRHDLLARIRRGCPSARVADLRVRVGEVHVPDEPIRPPEAPPPPALADEPSRETWEALSAIEDPTLRQAIANTRMALSKRVRG
jgi:hypothetical protein